MKKFRSVKGRSARKSKQWISVVKSNLEHILRNKWNWVIMKVPTWNSGDYNYIQSVVCERTVKWQYLKRRKSVISIPSLHPYSSTLNEGYPLYVLTLILIKRATIGVSRIRRAVWWPSVFPCRTFNRKKGEYFRFSLKLMAVCLHTLAFLDNKLLCT